MKKKREFRHCDLHLWPKITHFNRVFSLYPFGWNFVNKKTSDTQTHTHTHTHNTQTDRHIDKLQWKYNPSMISWRCKNSNMEHSEICQYLITKLQNKKIAVASVTVWRSIFLLASCLFRSRAFYASRSRTFSKKQVWVNRLEMLWSA